MKRLPVLVALAIVLSSAVYAQSLGEVARETRKTQGQRKKAARVYTNDDIPSVVIAPPIADAKADGPDGVKAADGSGTKATADKKGEAKAGDPDEAVKKLNESYRSRIEQQKGSIQLLEREVSVLERENQIQASEYYRNATTRLQNSQNWVEERNKRDAEIADKKALLEKAKESLSAIQEEAHKAGVTSGAIE